MKIRHVETELFHADKWRDSRLSQLSKHAHIDLLSPILRTPSCIHYTATNQSTSCLDITLLSHPEPPLSLRTARNYNHRFI
jgi:hypothetical protein